MQLSDLILFLWLLAAAWTSAGVIYPTAARVPRWSRWAVLGLGLLLLFVLALALAVSMQGFPRQDPSAPMLLAGALAMLANIVWPIYAIIRLFRSRKSVPGSSAEPAEARQQARAPSAQPAARAQPSRKSPPSQPAPPAVVPAQQGDSRASRNNWRLGDVEFTYEDSAGDITRRRVTVHSVTSEYLKGECHTRHAERTFRLDRIIGEVVDISTGELIPARRVFARYKL